MQINVECVPGEDFLRVTVVVQQGRAWKNGHRSE